MVPVTLTARSLSVSFSYKESEAAGAFPETDAERIARYRSFEKEELLEHAVGLDRGVVRPVQSSDRQEPYAFLPAQLERIKRKEKQRKHYQRLMQRKQKGSNNRSKARYRVSRTFDYSRNVIENFAHQTSHAIATDAGIWVIGVEALKIANITKHPMAKTDENGKFLPNGAKAKAGLNK